MRISSSLVTDFQSSADLNARLLIVECMIFINDQGQKKQQLADPAFS